MNIDNIYIRDIDVIKVNHDIPETLEPTFAYSPDGECLGEITRAVEALDFRNQVVLHNVKGYYIMCGDSRVDIDPETGGFTGNIPEGFFDTIRMLHKECWDMVKERNGYGK